MNPNPDSSTEHAILEAAEKLFLEKGSALTSTTEIARVAGCNQALVHYYFRTKEKLFYAIFEKKARMLVNSLFQSDLTNATFLEKVTRMVEAHFDVLRANPRVPFLVFNELITNPVRLKELNRNLEGLPQIFMNTLKTELEKEIAAGRIRPMTIHDLLLTIISLNVLPFLAGPIFRELALYSDKEYDLLMDHRRKENVTIILKSLQV